jgi:hypothetical protein
MQGKYFSAPKTLRRLRNHFVLGWPFADRTNFALLKIKP